MRYIAFYGASAYVRPSIRLELYLALTVLEIFKMCFVASGLLTDVTNGCDVWFVRQVQFYVIPIQSGCQKLNIIY